MNLRDLIERGMKLRAELVWVVVGQLLGFVGSFIGIKVLTTVMGPQGYGELALGLTIAGLFNMYLYGPLANVVARFFAVYRERGELAVYFKVLKQVHLWLAGALTALALLAGLLLWPWLGRAWALIGLTAILYSVVAGINGSYISLQSAIRQRQVVALHQGADVWLRTGLSSLLLLLFQASGSVALTGYLLGTVLVTLSQAHFARRNQELSCAWQGVPVGGAETRACRRQLTGYAASFVVFAGFAAVGMYADRWIIQGVFGIYEVGVYAAVYQIASAPVNLLFVLINQFMVPIIYERAGSMSSAEQSLNSSALIRQTIAAAALLSLIMVAASWALGKPLLQFFTTARFAQYHALLWIIVAGQAVFNIGQLLALYGLCRNRPQMYFWPKGWQAISLVVSGYLLALRYGLVGIALALCLSSCLYVAAVLAANHRLPRIPVG